MKKHIIIVLIIVINPFYSAQAQKKDSTSLPTISPKEVSILIGKWKGTLTYIDYTSGKPYTMPANIMIEQGKNDYTFIINNTYPDEPKANGKSTLKLAKDGRSIDGNTIISRLDFPDGEIEVVTEHEGKDGNDNNRATIRNVYIVSNETFVMRKEVRFVGTEKWIKRNEFSFTK